MYKCLDCGNTDKFIGFANEQGDVIIIKNDCKTTQSTNQSNEYSWIYIVSEKSWEADFKVKRCYYCNSDNIQNIQKI